MVVTIIGSVNSSIYKNRIEEVKTFCKDTLKAETIYAPLLDSDLSLYILQRNYLDRIENSDLIIVIPKKIKYMHHEGTDDDTNINMLVGESTSYELAYANKLGKKVMFWGLGDGDVI